MSLHPSGKPADPDGAHKMGPTRIRDLVAVAAVSGLALWIIAHYHYGLFPSLPWPAGLTLYLLAAIEVVVAFIVRSKVAGGKVGPTEQHLHPINIARSVALAKASALLGAIALGGWTGLFIYLRSRSELDVAVADQPAAIVGAVGGLVLVAAALWLEYCCRAPDDPAADTADASANPA